jgi:hypothetical protein
MKQLVQQTSMQVMPEACRPILESLEICTLVLGDEDLPP